MDGKTIYVTTKIECFQNFNAVQLEKFLGISYFSFFQDNKKISLYCSPPVFNSMLLKKFVLGQLQPIHTPFIMSVQNSLQPIGHWMHVNTYSMPDYLEMFHKISLLKTEGIVFIFDDSFLKQQSWITQSHKNIWDWVEGFVKDIMEQCFQKDIIFLAKNNHIYTKLIKLLYKNKILKQNMHIYLV